MATFEITVDDREVQDALRRLGDKASDLTPAMKQIGEYLRFRTEENFMGEQTPEGQAWQKLSPKTEANKAKKKGINMILQDTGDLRGSIAYEAGARSVKIGTNVMVGGYSLGAIHNYGAPARNIPARPFLGVSNDDRAEITQILLDYLNQIEN